MTGGKRVLLNAVATYGRSLVALAFGLFSTRWVIQGLGKVDFGLYSLVGATIAFVGTLNTILNGSVARFYAFEIGASEQRREHANDSLQKWFNTALFLHVVLAMCIFAIGYPLGAKAIACWLDIPLGRIPACLSVFRCALASCLIAVVSAPYIAMFVATQNIVEISLWGLLTVALTCASAYVVTKYSGDKMLLYAILMASSSIGINSCQVLRSRLRFPSCRVKVLEMISKSRIKELLSFAGWQSYAAVGDMLRCQGNAFVVNMFWGPVINGSYAISNQVSGHTSAMSHALQNAMSPAITAKAGSRDQKALMRYADSSNKLGAMLIAVFAIPFAFEINYVLRAWLTNVPEYTGSLCIATLLMIFIDKISGGNVMAIVASGKVGAYQMFSGSMAMLSVLVVYCGAKLGYSPVVVGVSFVLLNVVKLIARLFYARKHMQIPVLAWVRNILLPVSFVCSIMIAGCGIVSRCVGLDASLLRTVLVSLCSLLCCLLLSWRFVFNRDERRMVFDIWHAITRKVS